MELSIDFVVLQMLNSEYCQMHRANASVTILSDIRQFHQANPLLSWFHRNKQNQVENTYLNNKIELYNLLAETQLSLLYQTSK